MTILLTLSPPLSVSPSFVDIGCRILVLAETARKYESEREKVTPFYATTHIEVPPEAQQAQDKMTDETTVMGSSLGGNMASSRTQAHSTVPSPSELPTAPTHTCTHNAAQHCLEYDNLDATFAGVA
jgi:hypothetical protein